MRATKAQFKRRKDFIRAVGMQRSVRWDGVVLWTRIDKDKCYVMVDEDATKRNQASL